MNNGRREGSAHNDYFGLNEMNLEIPAHGHHCSFSPILPFITFHNQSLNYENCLTLIKAIVGTRVKRSFPRKRRKFSLASEPANNFKFRVTFPLPLPPPAPKVSIRCEVSLGYFFISARVSSDAFGDVYIYTSLLRLSPSICF